MRALISIQTATLLVLGLLYQPAVAQTGEVPALAESLAVEPRVIKVEADRFRIYLADEKAVWTGNVEARQGNYTFRTAQLTLHLEQITRSTASGQSDGPQKLNAMGYELHADELSYDVEVGQITASGNSELRRGAERILAERIIYTVASDTAEATPAANGRVVVQFLNDPQQPLFPAGGLSAASGR